MVQRVSVVISTTDRARSLQNTLRSLRQLDYPEFEVVVVKGPCNDDTERVLAQFAGQIKVVNCPVRNLSESRNIGIATAAGEYVAFIDDDAYPDPAWLDQLVARFSDWTVGAVGGPVYDHTGVIFQTRQLIADRFGNWDRIDLDPSPYMCFPGSNWAPYAMGTNSIYRRERLLEIGGFDEEFDYHLDETEVCRRLVECGCVIAYADDAFVYHKALPSQFRTMERALKSRLAVLKNKCFFALRHGLKGASFAEVCQDLAQFIAQQRTELADDIAHRGLDPRARERFDEEAAKAFDIAFRSYLSGRTRTRPKPFFERHTQPFRRFPTLCSKEEKLHVCLLTDEYAPGPLNGIGRTVHTLARGLAARGHVVRVLTNGNEPGQVGLEDGVWVHRVPIRHHEAPKRFPVPSLWAYSASILEELVRIDGLRPIDIVQAPNWGALGVAAMRDGRFRTILSLHTPLKTIASMDHRLQGRGGLQDEVKRLIEVEWSTYRLPTAYLASSPSIVQEIEEQYALKLDSGPIGLVGHGLPDAAAGVASARSDDGVEVLFVGRLEPRKGIDVLLAGIPELLDEFPTLRFTIVGNDAIRDQSGITYREGFEHSDTGRRLGERVRFTGIIDDADLALRYAACDIFVAPSRYESFGLILLEAMMFAKPVIACDIGGMARIVEHEGNGILVPPGDSEALRQAIARLVSSTELRTRFGARSRHLYESGYSAARMVDETNCFYGQLVGRAMGAHRIVVVEGAPNAGLQCQPTGEPREFNRANAVEATTSTVQTAQSGGARMDSRQRRGWWSPR